jgi:hypothetical protein
MTIDKLKLYNGSLRMVGERKLGSLRLEEDQGPLHHERVPDKDPVVEIPTAP